MWGVVEKRFCGAKTFGAQGALINGVRKHVLLSR
jgi:hypothetical protein